MWAKAPEEDAGPYLSLNAKAMDPQLLIGRLGADESETSTTLGHTWTVWAQGFGCLPKTAKDMGPPRQCVDLSTMEEFWGCWNRLPQPSELLGGSPVVVESGTFELHGTSSLSIFKKGVCPLWEDPESLSGGHFQFSVKPTLPGGLVDELWNNMVLGVIGGSIEPAAELTGARWVNKMYHRQKPHIRFELWYRHHDADDVYSLRGSLEACIRRGLDGKNKPVTWSRTEAVPHKPKNPPKAVRSEQHQYVFGITYDF